MLYNSAVMCKCANVHEVESWLMGRSGRNPEGRNCFWNWWSWWTKLFNIYQKEAVWTVSVWGVRASAVCSCPVRWLIQTRKWKKWRKQSGEWQYRRWPTSPGKLWFPGTWMSPLLLRVCWASSSWNAFSSPQSWSDSAPGASDHTRWHVGSPHACWPTHYHPGWGRWLFKLSNCHLQTLYISQMGHGMCSCWCREREQQGKNTFLGGTSADGTDVGENAS